MKDGVLQSLLNSAIQRAGQGDGSEQASRSPSAPAGVASVRAVHIALGELVEIGDDEFRSQWQILARGTPAEGAALHIRREIAELQCMVCFQKYHPAERRPLCPYCGSVGAKVLSGEQYRLEAVEVGDD